MNALSGNLGYELIQVVILVAIVSIFVIILQRVFGINIPDWVWKIGYILLGVAIFIIAMRFLQSL